MFVVLGNSWSRMLIGKTYYKGLSLPNILYGQELIIYNKNDLDRLWIIENKAFRFILQVPTYKSEINYLKHALNQKQWSPKLDYDQYYQYGRNWPKIGRTS